jgi:uncharacterized protein YdhG (YjbR/CyaY superfamily)
MERSKITYKDIDAYHALQPAEYKGLLEQLRHAIKQAAPTASETISYGMPAFKQNKVLVYYALNKKHLGFYPTPNAIEQFAQELKEFKTSKGAIQFPLDKPLPIPLIQDMVKFRVEEDSPSLNDTILSGVVHDVPEDMVQVLKTDTSLLERWNKLTPIQRNEWICWVTIVKKQETRAEHIQRMVEEINEGQRQPCCWPGCPHRRPLAQKWFKNGKDF